MRLGLQLWPYYPSAHGNHFDTMLAVVRACEQAGLDSVWMPDHFMFPDVEHPENEVPILECFVTLGAIAAATSRIRIGALVVGVPYRNPALLAKMCATLDVVSHGRSIIGLGAAWHEAEFTAYGWPFPPVKARMEMLEEAVQIVDRMLTQRPASFSGTHYSVTRAYNDPKPVQQPRPPIMIGGSGERVTLKLVAQYADYCNVFGDVATVAHLWDGLFISDHLQWLAPSPQPVGDPWILLTAMVMATQRIRLGILVTPLARRRPWKLARETVTLDHLSGGRLILGAGIGGDWIGEYSAFGEPADDQRHAEQLDEGLQVVAGLWSGAPFSFAGDHYHIRDVQFLPTPLQQPRIPIWVAGGWPRKRPFQRAARWDGVIPFKHDGLLMPDDCRAMLAEIRHQRSGGEPFDLICYESTVTEGSEVAGDMRARFAEAGVTWWLHGLDINFSQPFTELLERVRQGPPQLP